MKEKMLQGVQTITRLLCRMFAREAPRMNDAIHERVRTRRHALGQLVLCKGCCCGRTDKGRPALPEERLKSIWKAEKLLRTIQLTVSGCLGPCDVPNVVQVITPEGTEWYGRLDSEAHYDALVAWARACHATNRLMSRPEELAAYRFDGFIQEQRKA